MSPVAIHSSKLRPLRIFVVEDHPDTGKYLCMYLEVLGHRVSRATTVAEATELLLQTDCDMLICDIRLPDGNGWELLRTLRQLLPRPIYAIAVSAGVSVSDRRKSLEAGYRHHLDKPFFPLVMDAHLQRASSELAAQTGEGASPAS